MIGQTKSGAHTIGLLASLTALFVLAQFAQALVSNLELSVERSRLALSDAEFVRDAEAHYFMPYEGIKIVGHSGNTFSVQSNVGPRPRAIEVNWKDSARFFDRSGVQIVRTQPCHPSYTSVENIKSVFEDDCRKKDGAGWFQYQHWSKVMPPKPSKTESVWEYKQIKIPDGVRYVKICSHMRIQVPLLMGEILMKNHSICTPRYDMDTAVDILPSLKEEDSH